MTDFHKAGGIKVSVYRHLKIQKLVRIFFFPLFIIFHDLNLSNFVLKF
jgi:hypothetical protein